MKSGMRFVKRLTALLTLSIALSIGLVNNKTIFAQPVNCANPDYVNPLYPDRCLGSAPAECCCNGVIVTSPLYSSACSCEPVGGNNSNPCSRYSSAIHYGLNSASCSSDVCPSDYDKCYYPDGTGMGNNYAYSCEYQYPTPTLGPVPTYGPPADWLCQGMGIPLTAEVGFTVCNSTYRNCNAVASNCSTSCTSLNPDTPYKCFSQGDMYYANNDGENRYLFTCKRTSGECSGSFPPVPGPSGVPTPNQSDTGWPPGYPPPPQYAVPDPYVNCSRTRWPEFHSLRPYQASPCNTNFRQLALYCANSLTLQLNTTLSYNYLSPPVGCVNNGDGTSTCYQTITGSSDVAIDLSGADFPIMGYTEPSRSNIGDQSRPRVINSENWDLNNETLDDSAKVNEYVSWYLNGVIHRAEYYPSVYESPVSFSDPLSFFLRNPILTPESENKVVNYSGPLNKLLPKEIQNIERIEEIDEARRSVNNNRRLRHNQAAGCHFGFNFRIPIINQQITLGQLIVPCYDGTGISALFRSPVRLLSWWLANKLPPLESDYLGRPYEEFFIDYRAWRGDYCFVVEVNFPIIGLRNLYVCFDNPFTSNLWANLFPYIPMSSTEDMLGYVEAYATRVRASSSHYRVINLTFTPDRYGFAFLYVPHMAEADELGETLQRTYAPKGTNLLAESNTQFSEVDPYCDLREVRTNPGDELFAGEIRGRIDYNVEINATFYNGTGTSGQLCQALGGSCVNSRQYCNTYYGNTDCDVGQMCGSGCSGPGPGFCPSIYTCYPSNYTNCTGPTGIFCGSNYHCEISCSAPISSTIQSQNIPVNITLRLRTATPKADEVWKRLVAGAAGIARKLYPKVGEGMGGPIGFYGYAIFN